MMLTGDQRSTAEAVGRQLGLTPEAIRSRVTPEGKLELITMLQARGEIVAMTGDGVNDAPALARADIGIAMGRHGTDVARAAAIHFLFSCNLSEILVVFAAIVAGLPSPLAPLQILWVNLVTDILPVWVVLQTSPGPRAHTVAFVALVLIHPLQALHCRSTKAYWWRLPPNHLVWMALAALVAVQWWAVSWAPLTRLLGTVPLAAGDWLVVAAAIVWPVALLEALKHRR